MEKNISPLPIQSLWIGGQLSNVEKLCVQSFLDNGHQFHLYAYEDITNVPAGAQVFDANEIIGADAIFRYKEGWAKGSVSGFADLFRLLLIQKKGGWWVDMDIICLKKFDMEADTVFCTSYEGEYDSLVNNCVFKAPNDSPFLTYCLSEIAKLDLKNMGFGLAGPFLFQRAVKELKLQDKAAPFFYFNPITWKNVGDIILGRMDLKTRYKEKLRPVFKPATMIGRGIKKESYSLHLWNEVWNSNGYDKNGTYSSSSLFEKLKRKHGIS